MQRKGIFSGETYVRICGEIPVRVPVSYRKNCGNKSMVEYSKKKILKIFHRNFWSYLEDILKESPKALLGTFLEDLQGYFQSNSLRKPLEELPKNSWRNFRKNSLRYFEGYSKSILE